MGSSDGVESALRRSEQRYRSLVENIPSSVIILFDPELRILLVDGPEVEASGASKAAMEGKLPKECLPSDFAKVVESNFRRVLAGERFSMELPWEDRVYQYEYVPLRGDDGTIEHGLVVGQNVTRQHRSDVALRASEQRFRALFEAAPDAFILHDMAGRLLDGNHAAEVLFGLDRRVVVGQSLFDVGTFAPESLPKLGKALVDIQQGKGTGPEEIGFLRRDGAKLDVEMKAVPLQLPDQTVVLVAVRDVTDRNQAAQRQRLLEEQLHQAMKMEAIGRLAGGIAHDFNNMLTAILTNIELAMVGLAPTDQRFGDLEDAKQASQRAAVLVSDLLAFSRKQDIKPAVIDLDHLVAGCARLVGRLLGGSVVVTAVPNGRPVWVCVDSGKLEQVIVNLAINARDAMPNGGQLELSTTIVPELPDRANDPEVPYARLRVSDTGTGMPPEIVARLFEPFFTTKPVGKGTGLGLSIAYGIITQSAGHIRVQSSPGHGTTFEIFLPLASRKPTETQLEPVTARSAAVGSVLLIEDDEQVLRTIERCLRRHDIDVAVARTTDDALAYATDTAHAIDLVISDIVMPKLDGIALYDQLLAVRPRLPTLFVSGYAETALLERVNAYPHARFLRKPFSIDDLMAQVGEILEKREDR